MGYRYTDMGSVVNALRVLGSASFGAGLDVSGGIIYLDSTAVTIDGTAVTVVAAASLLGLYGTAEVTQGAAIPDATADVTGCSEIIASLDAIRTRLSGIGLTG